MLPPRGGAGRALWPAAETGTSLLELLLMVAMVAAVSAIGLGGLRHARAERAGREAARLLMYQLQAVANDARLSATDMAVTLTQPVDGVAMFQVLEDGNGNGVRVAEVAAGVDHHVGGPRPAFTEGSARLAIAQPVPTTDQSGTLPAGSAPVRFGIAPYISFSPRRAGASGSIYVVGPNRAHYAIRVLGSTGRLRLLCLNDTAFTWENC